MGQTLQSAIDPRCWPVHCGSASTRSSEMVLHMSGWASWGLVLAVRHKWLEQLSKKDGVSVPPLKRAMTDKQSVDVSRSECGMLWCWCVSQHGVACMGSAARRVYLSVHSSRSCVALVDSELDSDSSETRVFSASARLARKCGGFWKPISPPIREIIFATNSSIPLPDYRFINERRLVICGTATGWDSVELGCFDW